MQEGERSREGERRHGAGGAPALSVLGDSGAQPFGVVEPIDEHQVHGGVDGHQRLGGEELRALARALEQSRGDRRGITGAQAAMGQHHQHQLPALARWQVGVTVVDEVGERCGFLGGDLAVVRGELRLDPQVEPGHLFEDGRGLVEIARHAERASGAERRGESVAAAPRST